MRSGVTIREPLHVATNALQLFAIGAVGFVLNRVSFVKANPAFRQSLLDMENRVRASGGSSSIWPVKWQGIVNERMPAPELPSESPNLPAHSLDSADAPILGFPKADRAPQSNPNLPNRAEIPWWIPQGARADSELNQECASNRIQVPQLPERFRGGESWESSESSQHRIADAPAETQASLAESRMERLRGLFANIGLADLHRNRTNVSQLAPDVPDQNGAPEPDKKSDTDCSAGAPAELHSQMANAVQETAIVSPREFVPMKESVQDDEIRILPAKRGQYGLR